MDFKVFEGKVLNYLASVSFFWDFYPLNAKFALYFCLRKLLELGSSLVVVEGEKISEFGTTHPLRLKAHLSPVELSDLLGDREPKSDSLRVFLVSLGERTEPLEHLGLLVVADADASVEHTHLHCPLLQLLFEHEAAHNTDLSDLGELYRVGK